MWSLLALSASLACSVVALPSSSVYGVVETVNPPRSWKNVGVPDANHIIELRVGLHQSKFDELEKHLYEVSNPSHERYGAHLSKEEVEALVAPYSDSLDALNEWLASHGFMDEAVSRSPANDWAVIHMPVSIAEKMLDTTYFLWEHVSTGEYMVRTTSYSLPLHLHDHIDVIQPTTMFATFKGMKTEYILPDGDVEEAKINVNTLSASGRITTDAGVEVDPSCNTTVTLTCLKQLYNLVGYEPEAADKNSIATTGYLEQFANFYDYELFLEDQLPEAANSTFDVVSVKGGENDQNLTLSGAEAALDVQFAFGLAYPTNATYYTTAGRPPYKPDLIVTENTNEPYADWLDYVLARNDTPYVISTSYGEPEETIPPKYAARVCNGLAQLGARGVSLTFSSGDFGVGDGESGPDHICYTNDGRNITRFMPTFPATCPFVTAVGGTEYVPEIAVYFSGGGFSDIYPTPDYQLEAVTKYLDALPEGLYADLYNPQGRGFPDVAALGRRFRIFLSGEPRSIGGTSASSPTFAGIVALLNDARLARGLSTLGFLNPLLYSSNVAETFNDITVGNNPGCGTEGFNATEGWDPVTGLGTPNFYKMLDQVLSS